jgi:hypothetical protein
MIVRRFDAALEEFVTLLYSGQASARCSGAVALPQLLQRAISA